MAVPGSDSKRAGEHTPRGPRSSSLVNPEHLAQAGLEVGALKTAAFDATDPDQLGQFFEGLTDPIDHVMVTAGGSYYASIGDMDFAQVRRAFDEHLLLPMQVARAAARKMRPGGTLVFMTGTAARHPAVGSAITAILAAAVPAITAAPPDTMRQLRDWASPRTELMLSGGESDRSYCRGGW